MRRVRCFGAFAWGAFFIDDLNAGHDPRWLLWPRLAGKKAAVHENYAVLTIMIRQLHRIHVAPVAAAELLEGLVVTFLQMSRISRLAVVDQPQLVIAEQ